MQRTVCTGTSDNRCMETISVKAVRAAAETQNCHRQLLIIELLQETVSFRWHCS